MGTAVELKTPEAILTYEFDWSEEQTEGVFLSNVTHQAPFPVLVLNEMFDAPNWRSFVRLGAGEHGGVYVITATAVMSSGDTVPGSFVLRVMTDATDVDSASPSGYNVTTTEIA